MRLGKQSIAIVPLLVFAFCAIAPHESLPHVLAALPIRAAVNEQADKSTENESFEKLAVRAQAAMEAERIPEAIRLYGRATKLRPDWSEGWWHLGTLFVRCTGASGKHAMRSLISWQRKENSRAPDSGCSASANFS